jgi:nitrite reductase/ring-hydroxylating ferredoxin subunit
MTQRRRFLEMVGGSIVAGVALGDLGCTNVVSGTGGSGGGAQGGAGGAGTAQTTTGTGSQCGGGGAANLGINSDLCQSDRGRFAVGAPADYAAAGLHKTKNIQSNMLIGRDAGGLFALSSYCTHQCVDMNDAYQGQQLGSVSALGVRCNVHGSQFGLTGKVTKGPANKPLQAYALSLDCDGVLYVDTTQPVAASVRLAV